MYLIKIGNKEIGYIKEKQDINNYVEEIVNLKENKDIAFIDMKEETESKLQLVNRNTNTCNEKLKDEIKNNLSIEYTTYAITYDGKNTAYVSTMEEAENLVKAIKEEYTSKYTKEIGILQVYSNKYNEIEAVDIKKASIDVEKVINKDKNKNTVKVAKVNKKINPNINGVSFSVKPISGIITSRFGYRSSPGGIGSTNHKGLDISAKSGTTIKACSSGIVKFTGYKGSLGNLVIIDNGNNVETYYGHCSKIYVKKGQKVKAGEKIAAVGQTGAATGPHLHLEIHIKGIAVNPQKYIY